MRKKLKKLSLHRETLIELDRQDLKLAEGGATLTCRPDFCDFSGRATCTTCQLTCTTNYC